MGAARGEQGAEVRFLPASVLAQVHKATASVAENDDLDLDAALATCGEHPRLRLSVAWSRPRGLR